VNFYRRLASIGFHVGARLVILVTIQKWLTPMESSTRSERCIVARASIA